MAVCPAVTVAVAEEAEIAKSAMKIVRATDGLCDPLVPITERLTEPLGSGANPLTVSTLFFPAVMLPGLKAQVTEPLPEQLRPMAPAKLNCDVADILKTAVSDPFKTVAEVRSAVIAYPGTPVPENATVVGEAAMLDAMLSVPARAPVAVGVNVTLIVQLVVASGGAAQLSVTAKSPLAVTLLIRRGAVLVLVKAMGNTPLVVPTP